MKRPAGTIVTAVLQGLGSLFFVLAAVTTAFLPHFAPKGPAQPDLPSGLFFVVGAGYFVFACIGLATAVGVFLLKSWARYSTLIFAGFLIVMGLITAVTFAIMPFPAPPNDANAQLPPNFAIILKSIMAVMMLAVAALGGWWLFYFTRANIKQRFEGAHAGDVTSMSRRPLSIAILSVWSFIGIPFMLVGAWMAFPIAFFGIVVDGAGARIVYLSFAVVIFYIGIGLWRLVEASRLVAIAFNIFGCANTLLFYVLPRREERFQRLLTESSQIWHLPKMQQPISQAMIGAWSGMIVSVLMAAIAIYYLVTRRYAFGPEAALPSDVPPVMPG